MYEIDILYIYNVCACLCIRVCVYSYTHGSIMMAINDSNVALSNFIDDL